MPDCAELEQIPLQILKQTFRLHEDRKQRAKETFVKYHDLIHNLPTTEPRPVGKYSSSHQCRYLRVKAVDFNHQVGFTLSYLFHFFHGLDFDRKHGHLLYSFGLWSNICVNPRSESCLQTSSIRCISHRRFPPIVINQRDAFLLRRGHHRLPLDHHPLHQVPELGIRRQVHVVEHVHPPPHGIQERIHGREPAAHGERGPGPELRLDVAEALGDVRARGRLDRRPGALVGAGEHARVEEAAEAALVHDAGEPVEPLQGAHEVEVGGAHEVRRGAELVEVGADGGELGYGERRLLCVVAVADLEDGDHLLPVGVGVSVGEAVLLDQVDDNELIWEVGLVEEDVRHDGAGSRRDPEFELWGCHLGCFEGALFIDSH